jgi:hypothetical protein
MEQASPTNLRPLREEGMLGLKYWHKLRPALTRLREVGLDRPSSAMFPLPQVRSWGGSRRHRDLEPVFMPGE